MNCGSGSGRNVLESIGVGSWGDWHLGTVAVAGMPVKREPCKYFQRGRSSLSLSIWLIPCFHRVHGLLFNLLFLAISFYMLCNRRPTFMTWYMYKSNIMNDKMAVCPKCPTLNILRWIVYKLFGIPPLQAGFWDQSYLTMSGDMWYKISFHHATGLESIHNGQPLGWILNIVS